MLWACFALDRCLFSWAKFRILEVDQDFLAFGNFNSSLNFIYKGDWLVYFTELLVLCSSRRKVWLPRLRALSATITGATSWNIDTAAWGSDKQHTHRPTRSGNCAIETWCFVLLIRLKSCGPAALFSVCLTLLLWQAVNFEKGAALLLIIMLYSASIAGSYWGRGMNLFQQLLLFLFHLQEHLV